MEEQSNTPPQSSLPTPEKAVCNKVLLLAEDDRPTQLQLKAGLKNLSGFNILMAGNGQEALDRLKQEPVNVLVTDLNMPVMDGFSLMACVAERYPHLPVMVMTSIPESEHGNLPLKLGALRIFPKPVQLDQMMEEVRKVSECKPEGLVQGLPLTSFLQLMAWERKSATMMIKSSKGMGFLYMQDGAVVHAAVQDIEGLQAAYHLLAWENPSITFTARCRMAKTINLPLSELLLNAAIAQDTTNQNATAPAGTTPPPA